MSATSTNVLGMNNATASSPAKSTEIHHVNPCLGERVGEGGKRSEVEVFTTDISRQSE